MRARQAWRYFFRGGPPWRKIILATLLVLAIVASTGSAAPSAPNKSVLLLNSYGPDFAPYNFLTERLRDDLASVYGGSIDYYDASLASARYAEGANEKPLVDYLQSLFREHPLDLVIAIGAPAARFVQAYRSSLFPNVPMLLTAVEERRLDPQYYSANDAVIAFRLDLPALISNILTVLPATKAIDVVIGNSPNEQFWLSQLKKEFASFEGRVKFNWLNTLTLDEVLERVSRAPRDTAILFGPFNVDAAGIVHQGDRSLALIHGSAHAPLFSYVDAYFGRGVVGGPQIPLRDISKISAAVASGILKGEKPGKVAAIAFGSPVYDWRELQKWGIAEDVLPSGSIIEFRSPGLWERYKYYILAAIFTTAVQLFLIAGLLINRRSLREEHVERQRAEDEAQELAGRLINAHEEERERLARELHDDVTQRLAVLSIEAGHIEKELAPAPRGMRLKAVREGLIRLSEDVHALSYRLHPSILVDLGLAEALRSECDRFSEFSAITVNCDVDDLSDRTSQDVALCLFRIAQESLRNIARHAHATEAHVSVKPADGGLELIVRDNGKGFDRASIATKAKLGQASMRQRIRHLGGKFAIESTPDNGTLVRAWVSVREEVRDAPESIVG
ncbi:MAG: histidine kinase [Hyphomicrobiales bacterium]